MVNFFTKDGGVVFAVESTIAPSPHDIAKLVWLFDKAEYLSSERVPGFFVGPRKEMVTPWSTNAVEITQNMGVDGIIRIEEFFQVEDEQARFDPMLQRLYRELGQQLFTINKLPETIKYIDSISEYNKSEGLALSPEEVDYLEQLSTKLDRKLTDSEVFGFSQVNSEHCRHKIFNGVFIIDGVEKPSTLFALIKKTSKENPNRIVSAYKDNVAFVGGPIVEQFAPASQNKPDFFEVKNYESVISLKAETHNFPTTVEPFNGAATGTGGEIRDRMAGGKGSLPIAGTAVYMTSYPRSEVGKPWEENIEPRKWLYQTPAEILIKASNGASDFGNKFGQPLICGSLLTFEHVEKQKHFGFDKVIMLAGGVGYGKRADSLKDIPVKGQSLVVMGGDNYRIGMGGSAVSSVATGQFSNAIELNAVQRSNPEMQKRVCNAIRAMVELDKNPIVSIHDHGAGGHLNCLSELVEATGGNIDISKLPVGDQTLSAREIVGNESQERMGLVLNKQDVKLLREISERERAPMYVVGETTDNHQFKYENSITGEKPIDLQVEDMFGNPPKTILKDITVATNFADLSYDPQNVLTYLQNVLTLEAVACKDWLTNKVDRSVTGKVAKQQCCGEVQLPLNNVGVVALDYQGVKGIATSIGHAPVAGMVDAAAGSVLSIAEALTNLVWAPVEGGIKGVSLSANWMWPSKNPGEDARLYAAVEAVSQFAIELGVNIPTGKDSLSMTQKYPSGEVVFSPGTVIISSVAEVTNIRKVVEPVMVKNVNYPLYYIDFAGNNNFELGGSSFAQTLGALGNHVPTVDNGKYFASVFNTLQDAIKKDLIVAGHDISAGGLAVTLLEMCFPNSINGANVDLTAFSEQDLIRLLFSEKPAVVVQTDNEAALVELLSSNGVTHYKLGAPSNNRSLSIATNSTQLVFDIDTLRDVWFRPSFLLDKLQTKPELAFDRFKSYKFHSLEFSFPKTFTGKTLWEGIDLKRSVKSGVTAAIIREKGVNGDREMAWSLHIAGFDVKDVHMTDLITGRENLEDVSMIVFVGGFSNSDVLGSAKGWAGAFLYNPKAKAALDKFYARPDTLSLGVCNGCQLMVELGLINPSDDKKPKMHHNESGKFESAFLSVDVSESNSIMLQGLAGSRLGIWIAHGEGRFSFPYTIDNYIIPIAYTGCCYPANPNGSPAGAAAIGSPDGRHLAIMPHLERSIYPWQWAYCPSEHKLDEVTPWAMAFRNAFIWISATKR
ncbi:phosphoribosylformylglycinamidine synthase [Williamwhitmania taraxaci]|uniref:Phosphoribosylformylglycinamidine synthase n=1 Tax=Williamwhitmania taraxaci TaxID=1640674 RepID=A0A1G6RK97_9BACT|nr:phosphoribosylformylglycinamidine synthase [Williamwhitmania taraxaci]SDD05080.1 phosphoribosylformylglycinamidine synthase [Williamwhitmania taraxaci]